MSELIKALVSARKEIVGAKKDKTNPAFKGAKYADLAAIIEAVKEPLEKHGLTFVQDIKDACVLTVILHSSGERLDLAPFPIVTTKPDAQGHGSALTYARRYSLQTALGVPSEDDDGNAASKPAEEKKYPSPVTSALEGETFTKEQVTALNKLANSLVDLCTLSTEGEDVDYKIWELMEPLDSGERLYLWELLKPHSAVRTKVKAIVLEQQHKKTPATA